MTDEHKHAWEPVMHEWRRYRCTCGATGYRGGLNNEIRPHKVPRDYSDPHAQVVHAGGSERKGKRGPGGWSSGRP